MSVATKYRPITEKELGAPIYPGCKQNESFVAGEDEAGNNMIRVTFTTKDNVDKVMAFYAKRLGGKPQTDKRSADGTTVGIVRSEAQGVTLTASVISKKGEPTQLEISRLWNSTH